MVGHRSLHLINFTALPISDIIRVGRCLVRGSVLDASQAVFDPYGYFVTEYGPAPRMDRVKSRESYETGDFVALLDLRPHLTILRETALRCEMWPSRLELRKMFVDLALSAIGNCISNNDTADFLGVQRSDPSLLATTINKVQQRFIGLHVDSWTKRGVKDRASAKNRISINLGIEARSFLFHHLQVAKMVEEMREPDLHPTEAVRMYFNMHANAEVISCTVPPGYAYVAPTESLAHDASTLNMACEDLTATILGTFLPLESFGGDVCSLQVSA